MFTPDNNQDIKLDPEQLNNFLLLDSVVEISNNIPHTDTHFYDILDERPILPETFHWQDVSSEEIYNIVSKFSNSKSADFHFLSNYVVKMIIDTIKEV